VTAADQMNRPRSLASEQYFVPLCEAYQAVRSNQWRSQGSMRLKFP